MNSKIIKCFILPLADFVMQTKISAYQRQIKKLQKLNSREIKAWQHKHLQQLIHHAYCQTEYYQTLFDNNNIKPDDIQTIDDLKRLPVLTKFDIKNNYEKLIPRNINQIPHKKASTGGSSGDPMSYFLDLRSWSFFNANYIINWEKSGYRYGDKHIALGSTSLFVDKKPSLKHKLFYGLKNKIGLNGINMSREVCKKYIEFIKKKKIRFLYGYASAIYLLAKWVIENNEKVTIQSCFTTSEVLTNQYRKTILEAFQCEIVDCYGARDGGITAFAHEENFFEVGYNSLVRIENSDKNSMGPALLTDLLNYAMPLINYQLGDELLIDKKHNKEYNYNGQIINKVIGRTSDIIQLSNGNILTGPGFTILFKDIPVEYYCIEKTAIDSLTCWIIKLPQFNPSYEKVILQTLKKQAGDNISIKIKYTDKPFLSKSGKRKYMVNNSNI